jgi:hypothetical protein
VRDSHIPDGDYFECHRHARIPQVASRVKRGLRSLDQVARSIERSDRVLRRPHRRLVYNEERQNRHEKRHRNQTACRDERRQTAARTSNFISEPHF